MGGYYTDKLSAERLRRCYEIAPSRVNQYLDAEVEHVLEKINPGDTVLELGCGYGRVLSRLVHKAGLVIGIDTALDSLLLGREMLEGVSNYRLFRMDTVKLGFRDRIFNRVVCIQNGISAFHVNHCDLMRESIRVTKPGGIIFFSSYSNKFWRYRLEWFQMKSDAGLLGEFDREKTHDGVIVCKDGFTATTIQPEQFLSLTEEFDVETKIVEVDESSIFCEITPSSD